MSFRRPLETALHLLSSSLLLFVCTSAVFAQEAAAPSADPLPALRHAIETGHAAEALPRLDSLVASAPPGPGLAAVQTLRGQAFYAQGRLGDADTSFAQALRADPGSGEAAQMRGLTLFRLGRPAEAIPLLESSVGKTEQAKADPSYVLALCYVDTRRYDDARRAFARQYGFAPDSAEAYLLAARMLLRREYLPIAQQFAQKALALDPGLPLAESLLGEIELAGNHLPEAAKDFEAERARNPLEPSVYDRLGDTYAREGDYARARQALQQAVLLEPQATGPYILLGKVMLKGGDAVGALQYLEHARSMDPSNYMTRNLLGQAYRAEGRREEATAETEAAERLQAASEPKLAQPQ